MFEIPLAYKYVTVMVMIGEINYYAARMHLPIEVPVKEQDIRRERVAPTEFRKIGGLIQVKNYAFTFDDGQRIIRNLESDGMQSFGIPLMPGDTSNSLMERASRMHYSVSTNDVYRLATNWLVALDMDVKRLEKADPPIIYDGPFLSSRGPVPSPLVEVTWHNPLIRGYDKSEVLVEVSAVSGELITLDEGDVSFSTEPHPLIRDLDKLEAIPDEEFLKYSPTECSNLVARFSNVQHPVLSDVLPQGTTNAPGMLRSAKK